jgi:hypothetical protein
LEARTTLGNVREFTMPHDTGLRIFLGQFLEQGIHRSLLGFSPSVGRAPLLIQTTFIANAERTAVVVAGMSDSDILGENGNDGAVATDVIVIRRVAEAGFASRYQRFLAEGAVAIIWRTFLTVDHFIMQSI